MYKNKKNVIGYMILGFIAFSSIGNYMLTYILKLPFYLIEIFFIPIIIIYGNFIIKNLWEVINKKSISFFVIMTILTFNIIVGSVRIGNPLDVITMTRSLIYIILLIYFFSYVGDVCVNRIYFICIGSMIGELIFSLYIAPKLPGYRGIAPMNLISLPLSILIPIVDKKYIVALISFCLGLIVSINSGFRVGFIILISCLLVMIVWLIANREVYRDKNKGIVMLLNRFCVVFGCVGLAGLGWSKLFDLIEWIAKVTNMDQFAYYRITTRLASLFNLDFAASQDLGRINKYEIALTEFIGCIIPQGLIGKNSGRLGDYIDVPIIFMYDAFGSIVSIIIIIIVIIKGLKAFVRAFNIYSSKTQKVFGLMFPIYLLLFIVNGRFFYITYESILTGIIIGSWFYIDNSYKKKGVRL